MQVHCQQPRPAAAEGLVSYHHNHAHRACQLDSQAEQTCSGGLSAHHLPHLHGGEQHLQPVCGHPGGQSTQAAEGGYVPTCIALPCHAFASASTQSNSGLQLLALCTQSALAGASCTMSNLSGPTIQALKKISLPWLYMVLALYWQVQVVSRLVG